MNPGKKAVAPKDNGFLNVLEKIERIEAPAVVDPVAGRAIVAFHEVPPLGQPGKVPNAPRDVAAPAARVGIPHGNHRRRPEGHVPVGLGNRGRQALALVAARAAELLRGMRRQQVARVGAERLRLVAEPRITGTLSPGNW